MYVLCTTARSLLPAPKDVSIFLSAFISSARTVTFHIQKQFSAGSEKEAYEKMRNEMLKDDVSEFFKDLRNAMEKQSYPELIVDQLVAHRNTRTEQKVWIQLSATTTLFDGITELFPLESLIRKIGKLQMRHNRLFKSNIFGNFQTSPAAPKRLL